MSSGSPTTKLDSVLMARPRRQFTTYTGFFRVNQAEANLLEELLALIGIHRYIKAEFKESMLVGPTAVSQ